MVSNNADSGGNGGVAQALVSELIQSVGETSKQITVKINFDIIRLFSEGLYQSPHKAVEELVSNSFDAGALDVHVIIPAISNTEHSLWVIDNGSGMDEAGLEVLWEVANSPKEAPDAVRFRDRSPIGQFGIGKLAAYVLAWRLTHVTKVSNQYLYVSMDFSKVQGRQWAPELEPLKLDVKQLSESDAMKLVSEVQDRDPEAWSLLFGDTASPTWTAATLSEFKDLASKLRAGTLGWVLPTGLPLTSDFSIYLNGTQLEPAKTSIAPLKTLTIGVDDNAAISMKEEGVVMNAGGGIDLPGLGNVTGEANIYRQTLTEGKSSQMGRSNGFFVKVRGRVINLNDELFGLDTLNHAAWSRFSMELEAEGLREFLQSSREGVRDSEQVDLLRDYMHQKFNECRNIYEAQIERDFTGVDLDRLLQDTPSTLVRVPLTDSIRGRLTGGYPSMYYINTPVFESDTEQAEWLQNLDQELESAIFKAISYEHLGSRGPLAEYDAMNQSLKINEDHPLVARAIGGHRDRGPVTLLAQSEVLLEPLLYQAGASGPLVSELVLSRDKVLRALIGDGPVVAAEAMRLLGIANADETAMERAVGYAFEALGLTYRKRKTVGGYDGLIEARLGRRGGDNATYSAVFDAKTTDAPAVAASSIPFSRIVQFRNDAGANYSFVVAKRYEGGDDPESSANRSAGQEKVSLLETNELIKLLTLHLKYGISLTRLKALFEESYSVLEVRSWIERLEKDLRKPESQVPILELLETLESLKEDGKASPTVYAARFKSVELEKFTPEQLEAALSAIETVVGRGWVSFQGVEIFLDQSPQQIVAEVQRALREDLGMMTN